MSTSQAHDIKRFFFFFDKHQVDVYLFTWLLLLFPSFFFLYFLLLYSLPIHVMGVTSSKFQRKNKLQIIDFGSITPLGLYEKNNGDYDLQVVRELILSKKLSPFYKGNSQQVVFLIKKKKNS